MNSKRLKIAGLFTFGVALLIIIYYLIGLEKIMYQISRLNLFYYFIAIIFIFLTILSWAMKWKVFIKNSGYDAPILSLLGYLFVGIAINNLTPVAKLGGEPFRIYLLKKRNRVPSRIGSATVLAELTIELILSFLFVIGSILLIVISGQSPIWLNVILIIFLTLSFIAFGFLFGIYSKKRFISRLILWFTKKIKKIKPFESSILKWYDEFQESFKKSLEDRRTFYHAFVYGILMKFFDMMKFLFIFWALGYHVNILEIVIAMGMMTILMSVPITPGSLGILEAGMISAFTLIGIPVGIAASAIFLERLIWFWGVLCIGGLLGIKYGIKFSEKPKIKKI